MVDPFRYTRALFDDEWPSSDTHPTDPQTIPPITGKVKDAGQIYIIIILVGWSWSLLHTPPTHWKKRQWRSWWSRWRISLTIFPCNRYSIVSFDDDDPARAEEEENEQWQEKCGIVKTWIDWWLGLTDWTRRDNLWASEIAGQMRLCHVEGNPQFHWILLLFLNN